MKWWYFVLVITLYIGILFIPNFLPSNPIETTQAGALTALQHIQEWAKWMAGIQTAALAVLVYITFDKDTVQIRELPSLVTIFVSTAYLFLGSAIFCSAWILSSLPSLAIRVHSIVVKSGIVFSDFDVYELPLYGWFEPLKLSYLLTISHWLWGVGLLMLGLTIGSLLFSGSRG